MKTTNILAIYNALTDLGAVTIGHDVSVPSILSEKWTFIDIEDYIDTPFRFGWIQKQDYKLSKEATDFVEKVNKMLLEHIDTTSSKLRKEMIE